jgi:hypothetical protein
MAYYSAQQKTNGKWYYSYANGAGTFDIGYCNKCGGHENAEQALECYRQYNLDHAEQNIDPDNQKKCAICQKWTQLYIAFQETSFPQNYYFCKKTL